MSRNLSACPSVTSIRKHRQPVLLGFFLCSVLKNRLLNQYLDSKSLKKISISIEVFNSKIF